VFYIVAQTPNAGGGGFVVWKCFEIGDTLRLALYREDIFEKNKSDLGPQKVLYVPADVGGGWPVRRFDGSGAGPFAWVDAMAGGCGGWSAWRRLRELPDGSA